MAKIAFFDAEPWMKQVIEKSLSKHSVQIFEECLSDKHLPKIKDTELLVVFIYSKVSKEVIKSLPKLKFVATTSTGFDHIDVKACQEKKITVCNVPFYGENTVAEHAMALILSISRLIPQSVERTRSGEFSYTGLRGFDLKGKILGVVGSGHIGLNLIRYAKAFGMDVLCFDVVLNKDAAKELGFRYVSLDELLSKSDIVSLHAPYNPHTHHMINKANIGKLKKGAIIINTARGGLIETEALISALDSGIVSAAGLDVLEGENALLDHGKAVQDPQSKSEDIKLLAQDHILLKHPRVFVTPHNAFNTWEAIRRILDTTLENIDSFQKGEPKNVVKLV